MHRKPGKILTVVSTTIVIAAVFVLSYVAHAASSVVGTRDDTYSKLEEGAKVQQVVNVARKCLASVHPFGGKSTITGQDAAKGDVSYAGGPFGVGTYVSTSLWLESEIQGNGGDDGAIWCSQSGANGSIWNLLAKALGKDLVSEVLCNGNSAGILTRVNTKYIYNGYFTYGQSTESCSAMDASKALYQKSEVAEDYLKQLYEEYRQESGNQYLPEWNSISSYNNMSGYFNYILDYDLKCSGNSIIASSPSDYNSHTLYTYDKSEGKIVEKKTYVELGSNISWSYGIAEDSPTSCSGLIDRIEELRTSANGVSSEGYYDIIKNELNDSCKNQTTSDGANAYEVLKTKLETTINSSEASEEEKAEAQASLDKLNNAISTGNYVEESGDAESETGKIYQCVDIAGLETIVNDYEYNLDGTDGDVNEEQYTCFTNAGALGWILCPVFDALGKAADKLYTSIVEPFLQIDLQLFTGVGNSGSSIYDAWSIFQNIANIIFVILFLIIIFSQITGYGIDNYGIKKALPKLIVAAILINLSYIICQLAVELSNVLGYGVRWFFNNIADSIEIPSLLGSSALGVGVGANVFTTIIAVLMSGAGFFIIATNGLAILIPVIFALLSALISIFFFFVILGLRQAGVVLAVAISPLAFVLYILPNTKKLFDRWLSIFKGLLLLFPLCGLLMGAGNLASRILLSANPDSFFMILAAMLISVLPFFLLPTLFRASFAALGNIGAKIQNFGRGVNRQVQTKARPGFERSRAGQYLQRGKNYREFRRAEGAKLRESEYRRGKAEQYIDKYGNKPITDLTAEQRVRLSNARQILSAYDAQQTKAYADTFARMGTGQEVANYFDQAIASNDSSMMSAVLSELQNRGEYGLITDKMKNLSEGQLKGMDSEMTNTLTNSFITKKKDAAHLWGWAKAMKSSEEPITLQNYVATGGMQKDLAKESDDLITTQDKTSLEAINSLTGNNASLAFSNKQMAYAANNISKQNNLNEFNKMLAGSTDGGKSIISNMNAAQLAKLKSDTVATLSRNPDFENWMNIGALQDLFANPQNASLVANMNPQVKQKLRKALRSRTHI